MTLATILGIVGNIAIVSGLWGIGNQKRGAFWFSIVGEAAWIVKSCLLGMWDLAFICAIFFLMAVRALMKWKSPLEPQCCSRKSGHSGPCNGWCCRK